MSISLDWIQEVVLDPIQKDESPGQIDLGLASVRAWDRCVCGGVVSVEDDGDVMAAVARHNQSDRHSEWRVLGGMELTVDTEMFGRVPI